MTEETKLPEMAEDRNRLCRDWDKLWWGSDMECTVCGIALSHNHHPDGPCIPPDPTPQDIVRRDYPTAFVDDDGENIYIRTKIITTEKCSCGHVHEHKITDYRNTLGSGGTAEYAWQDALIRIKTP